MTSNQHFLWRNLPLEVCTRYLWRYLTYMPEIYFWKFTWDIYEHTFELKFAGWNLLLEVFRMLVQAKTHSDSSAKCYWKNVCGKSKTVSSILRYLPARKDHVSNVRGAWFYLTLHSTNFIWDSIQLTLLKAAPTWLYMGLHIQLTLFESASNKFSLKLTACQFTWCSFPRKFPEIALIYFCSSHLGISQTEEYLQNLEGPLLIFLWNS